LRLLLIHWIILCEVCPHSLRWLECRILGPEDPDRHRVGVFMSCTCDVYECKEHNKHDVPRPRFGVSCWFLKGWSGQDPVPPGKVEHWLRSYSNGYTYTVVVDDEPRQDCTERAIAALETRIREAYE
jgi:hypothetical protein